MAPVRWVRVVVAVLLFCRTAVTAILPPVVATLRIDRLFPSGTKKTTLVFLNEDALALLAWSSDDYGLTTHMLTLRLESNRMVVLARKDAPIEARELYAVSQGRLLLSGAQHTYLYSQDLAQNWELPIVKVRNVFPGTDIVGDFWSRGNVFRLTSPPAPIPRRGVELVATSDSVLLYKTEGRLEPVTPESVHLGSIPATTEYFINVDVAGPGRLYFHNETKKERVTDLTGKTIRRVAEPKGWGFRDGWSSDGSRLLFDHYLRDVSPGGRGFDALTGSLGASQRDNAELVRVIDVSTGGICFNFESRHTLLGATGAYHADVSPSGRLVAVASQTELTVYRLPAVCSEQ